MSIAKQYGVLVCLLLSLIFNTSTFAYNTSTVAEPLADDCNQVPLIYCPAFVWLKPSESAHPNRTGYAVAEAGSTGCSAPIVTYRDEIYVINDCHKVYTRIWTATDPNNSALTDTCHQTIKQVDEEAPVFLAPQDDLVIYTDNMDLQTSTCQAQVYWTYPRVSDNHLLQRIEITSKFNGQETNLRSGSIFPAGVTTVTYTAFDFCGNFTTMEFTVNVMCADCHISCPADFVGDLNADISPAVIGNPTAYSGNTNCGTLTNTFFEDELVATGCNDQSTTLRTWFGTYSSMPSRLFSCQQKITLQDMSAIVLYDCPSDINIVDNFTPVHWKEPIAVASDNANILTLTSNYSPGTFFPVGITTVFYTATDKCGNSASCSFRVSVLEDATYPGCPDDIELTCDESGTAILNYTPPSYDGTCSTCNNGGIKHGFIYIGSFNGSNYYCSRNFNTYLEAQELMAQHGGHLATINSEEENDFIATRIATATALIGLSDYNSEGDFTWDDGSDLTYTNWYKHQPNDYNNQDFVEIQKNTGLWNDVDNNSKLEFVMEIPCENVRHISGPLPGDRLRPGTYTVIYNISDGCGVDDFCTFDVTVREGLSVICPDDIYVEVSASTAEVAVNWDVPHFFSCCSACTDPNSCVTITQTEGPASGSSFPNQSKTPITYQATDACGNVMKCSFRVLVDIDPFAGRVTNDDSDIVGFAPADSGSEAEETEIDLTAENLNKKQSNQSHVATIKARAYKLYPNPTTDIVNVDVDDPNAVAAIKLVNSTGQLLVHRNKGIYSSNLIDCTQLAKNVYFLVIEYKDGSQETSRLVKM